jgi:hypothetical protein
MMMQGLANPKLLDFFIFIIENPWDGSKKFSFLSNLTVVNIMRTSHGNKKNLLFVCFVQNRIMDFFDLDLFGDTVPIGSLDNGDGQVSVTRSYTIFLSALHTS